jgi:CRISPR/Cas system-associated exonuclease Cas4 (RecB family)
MSANLERIASFVKRRFLSAVVRDMEKDAEQLKGIQVTDICYDCLRRAYYQILSRERGGEQEYKGMRESDWLRVWIGKKLHETDFSELHELNVNALGVHGRIDEILVTDKEVVIVDKKSTRKIPNRPYEHHLKQVQYYATLLRYTELWPMLKGKTFYGAVLYIDVNEGLCEVHVFPLSPEDRLIEREITEKVAVLKRAFSEGKPPEPSAGFLCDYCDFLYHCVREGSKP